MRRWMTKEFWFDVLERVISTFCEGIVISLSAMTAFDQIDWPFVFVGAGVGALVAFCKCFVKEAFCKEE